MNDYASEEPGGQPRGICAGLRVNRLGHLEMGGVDLAVLARKMGTPLYVLDEVAIREQCRQYREAFSANYPRWDVVYASKALANKGIMCIMRQEGVSLDVVSGGELYTAISAGFPPQRIYFHGNNKSEDEILLGLDYGVGRFIVDSVTEFEVLNRISRARDSTADILIRIRPEIEAHCHDYVRTGSSDSKFGVSLREALYIARLCVRSSSVNLRGVHCHIGSQILETEPFEQAARIMVRMLAGLRQEMRRAGAADLPDEIDLGGGLGVVDAAGQKAPSIDDYARAVCDAAKDEWRRVHDRGQAPALPRIVVEPGRSIVNAAGVTLYSVGGVKVSGNGRHYLAVDGGMADNPRPALYGARYSAALANRGADKPDLEYRVVGKCCESGDMLIENAPLPRVRRGDILAVTGTGAYNYSMASNYNRLPRPAMVLVSGGSWDVIVRRETYEDLTALDVVPPRLYARNVEVDAGHVAANG